MERRFIAEAHTDFVEKLETGELDWLKQKKAPVSFDVGGFYDLVAGAGFEPAAFRL
ncbi:hypothetical protein [Sinorhizobium mexicanum]|uniref:hypothetical protein n=1 Tax=Sinorhizobium mexicanum TaxID=375549 RepID=UPI001AE571A5|nr:hypothetical protein [Sinorhizobium mexicanum]MBP1888016.1 hypothetical protein [Sinorhizobium mexicanum]